MSYLASIALHNDEARRKTYINEGNLISAQLKEIVSNAGHQDLHSTLKLMAQLCVLKALADSGGNACEAARRLNVHRNTLSRIVSPAAQASLRVGSKHYRRVEK